MDDDESYRTLAMGLLNEELKKLDPDQDYLDYLPDIEVRPFRTELIKNEQNSIEKRRGDLLESSSFGDMKLSVPPPKSSTMDAHEVELWTSCLKQVKIKLEYRHRQLINLELMKKYGPTAWKKYLNEEERKETYSMDSKLNECNEAMSNDG